jgi:phenylacetate-CoA ligase
MIDVFKRIIKKNSNIEYMARKIRNIRPLHKRLSKDFWDFYNLLDTTQYYDKNQLQELQFTLLKETIENAYNNSGFYRNLYDEYGVKIGDIQSFEDFKKYVPIVNKQMLRTAKNLTISSSQMYKITTSGTSGSPFQFYGDKSSIEKELAGIYHQWSRIGFTLADRRVEMRGFQVKPICEYPDINITRFSIVNMDNHIKSMVDYINKSKIQYIHGYPSAIAKFAGLLKEHSLIIEHQIKGVMLASENVYSWQIERIKDGIEPQKIISHYGNSEQVVLGAWCEHSDCYHFLPLYGLLEQGDNKEIIGTGFLNRVTPFIRYQMNDILADYSEASCDCCGRGYMPIVKQIGGRLEDYLTDEKGELIPPAVVTFPFKSLQVMKEVQVIQKKNRNILLRYVIANKDELALVMEKNKLIQGFQILLGTSIKVYFEEASSIKLTDACKFKWIISEADKS